MNAETKVKAAAGISAALVKALTEIEGVTKDKVNPHFKSKYADLASVLDSVRPVFAKYDMAVTQETSPSEDGVIVETVVLHASGEERRFGKLYVPANKRDAQGAGSALTYARRYSLMTAFGVPAEDDDGNAAARSTANPKTGEVPPSKSAHPGENFVAREVLEGPYSSGTALRGAIKAFAGTLAAQDDLGGFVALMESPDVIELEKQALRYLPGWWDTGEGCANDFEPMTSRIHRKRQELEEIESIKNASNIFQAG